MFTIILFAVLGFAFGYWMMSPVGDGFFGGVMFAAAGTMFGVLFSMLILSTIFTTSEDFRKYTSEKTLVSLDNNVSSEGSFFLGTGSIQGNKRYYYLVKTKRGIHSRSVDAGDTYIVEHDSMAGSPKIVSHNYVPKFRLFYFPMDRKIQDFHRIHIPEGSIRREYKPN